MGSSGGGVGEDMQGKEEERRTVGEPVWSVELIPESGPQRALTIPVRPDPVD